MDERFGILKGLSLYFLLKSVPFTLPTTVLYTTLLKKNKKQLKKVKASSRLALQPVLVSWVPQSLTLCIGCEPVKPVLGGRPGDFGLRRGLVSATWTGLQLFTSNLSGLREVTSASCSFVSLPASPCCLNY